MSQIHTITPFLATVPGLDERILRDIGLDAEGNVADKDDPRFRRRAISRPFLDQPIALLSMRGGLPLQRS